MVVMNQDSNLGVTNVNIPGYCGARFVGSYIVEKLLERKDSVRVPDNFSTGEVKY